MIMEFRKSIVAAERRLLERVCALLTNGIQKAELSGKTVTQTEKNFAYHAVRIAAVQLLLAECDWMEYRYKWDLRKWPFCSMSLFDVSDKDIDINDDQEAWRRYVAEQEGRLTAVPPPE